MSNIGIGVNFTGTESVNRTINNVKSGLSGLEKEAKSVGNSSSDAFNKAKSGMEELGKAVEKTGGSFTVLKGASAVFLGELAMKIQSVAIKAIKMLVREMIELGKEMIALGLESNSSAKSMFDNFNTQVTNLKRLFGEELVTVIGPALQDVATRISELISAGDFEPLIKSFGSLATKMVDLGIKTWDLVKAMMNVTDDEEAITKIADAFDRVGYVVGELNKLLEKTAALVNTLHLDQIYNFMNAGTPGGAVWEYLGARTGGINKPQQRTSWGQPTKDPTKAAVENAKATDTSTSAIEEAIKKKKEEIRTIAQATLIEIGYSSTTRETDKSIGKLGNVAASAVSHINSALSSGGGGGGGGGGCKTAGTRTSSSGSCASGACSGSWSYDPSGIGEWRNVLGNQYMGTVNAMGEEWARSITQVNNSNRTGDMTSFSTSSGATFVNTGNGIVQVNDALIKKDGSVVKFHPDDNILAFKGNSGMKGNTNITINVNGAGDPERVAELILKKINSKVGMAW